MVINYSDGHVVAQEGQLLVPLVEPCCPGQSVCHITVSRLMSEQILNIYIYKLHHVV